VPQERREASFGAAPLTDMVMTPFSAKRKHVENVS
jgi:hypothetical protein